MSVFKKRSKDTMPSRPYEVCLFSHIGTRPKQEDCCHFARLHDQDILFAVLADGMGGLDDGDRVSSFMTREMTERMEALVPEHYPTALTDALYAANQAINQALGEDGIYKCGSTLLAVLTDLTTFHWLAVGDSRIYLLRHNTLIRLNEEHNYLSLLLTEALNGRLSTEAALQNPDAKKLTSFIGMGELALVDHSHRGIPIMKGDKLLLMSDGVFGTIEDEEIRKIMTKSKTLKEAAATLEKAVKKKHKKHQDNFSAVMMEFLTGEEEK